MSHEHESETKLLTYGSLIPATANSFEQVATRASEDELMTCLNREFASLLARRRIDQLAQAAGDEFAILSDATKEIDQGWVFFFNTADYVRTRNPASALAGNGPILVTREGVIHELPSAIPWEDAVKQI